MGSSGGAVIGVALAEHHPEVVRTLVAHEPPLLALLPADAEVHAQNQEVYETYLREGAGPAMEQFMALTGIEETQPVEMSPEEQAALEQEMARMGQNLDFFFANYLLPITGYRPDAATLRAGSPRIVIGVGEDSAGQTAHETAIALAAQLGSPAVAFPGDHIGMFSQPEAFTAKLHEVFQES